MDTLVTPRTPAELVATVLCPVARVVWVTALADRKRTLRAEWAAQRLADMRVALTQHSQARIVSETGLSRARVSQLAAEALKECSP